MRPGKTMLQVWRTKDHSFHIEDVLCEGVRQAVVYKDTPVFYIFIEKYF